MGKNVNKRDLAEILGVSERTLTEWQALGMPMLHKGERGESNDYDTAEVITWWMGREKSKIENESQRDRLARLQGDRMELELERELQRVAPVEAFETMWTNAYTALRVSTFNELPRLAQMLEAMPGQSGKLQVLTETFTDLYTKLSQLNVDSLEAEHGAGEGPDAEGPALPGAPAEPQDQ
jgi:phage terminase Nu1 subunit (DNA packaging protein)